MGDTKFKIKRRTAILASVVLATAVLASCNLGFDPGMTTRCAATWNQGDARSYAVQTDCPDLGGAMAANKFWMLGSNAPYGSSQYCGTVGAAFRPSGDGTTPLLFDFFGSGANTTAEIGIVKDSCSTNHAEISFSQQQPTNVRVAGLKMEDNISLMHAEGTYSVAYNAAFQMNGANRGLALALRPHATDPRWNYPDGPNGCVLYHGGTDRPGASFIVLDAHCFGSAAMSCANCAYAHEQFNWDDAFNWVFQHHPSWWPDVQAIYPTLTAQIRLVTGTFRTSSDDPAARVKVWHTGWRLWHD